MTPKNIPMPPDDGLDPEFEDLLVFTSYNALAVPMRLAHLVIPHVVHLERTWKDGRNCYTFGNHKPMEFHYVKRDTLIADAVAKKLEDAQKEEGK